MNTTVLGVKVDGFSLKVLLERTKEALYRGSPFYIFTPNPEILVKANEDAYYKEVLNKSSLSPCDGMGLYLAGKIHGLHFERVTGTDYLAHLMELAQEHGKTVFLLGAEFHSTLEAAKEELLKLYPALKIVGTDPGPKITEVQNQNLQIDASQNEKLIQKINLAKPDILVVAFGMGKQEKWIIENSSKMPTVTIFIGVGGALDFIAKKIPRAPLLMRRIGLEWVYRMYKQPARFRRICNATVVFTYLVLTDVWRSQKKK